MNEAFIIATKNRKKLAELSRILAPLGIHAVSESDWNVVLPEVEETGTTFAENAFLKAHSAMLATGLPAVADDSGLCVDALSGAPGVYSARYAGEGATDGERIQKLLDAMKNVPDPQRTAKFVTAVCVVLPNEETLTVTGTCSGVIARQPAGQGGFGYDPIFRYGDRSFAELSAEEKDQISHRGNALRALQKALPDFLKKSNLKGTK